MPLISVVLVSYRSGALAVRALESFRRDAEASGLRLETIAVVNSGDPGEVRALSGSADRVIDPGRNLGFAGGLNAGVNAAAGDVLLLANADLV
ncbi:MAG TPA: glycosyltransferase, partial [Thermoanaerobaculia bacterium]|nr:glycosyltransferase [Thermoanaerobaculia bacterium]